MYINSPRHINYMPNIQLFLEMWCDSEHVLNNATEKFYESAFGNKNYTGRPGDISGPSFTLHQADFIKSLEKGIIDLVIVLVKQYQLITYTSCEGHYYNGISQNSERHVGILPRTDREYKQVLSVFEEITTGINKIKNDIIDLALAPGLLSDEKQQLTVIDIYFKKKANVTWEQYFKELSSFYAKTLSKCREIPSLI